MPSSLQEVLLLGGVLVIIGDELLSSRELLGSDHYAMLDGQGCSKGYQNLNSLEECSAAARGLKLIAKSQAAWLAGHSYFPCEASCTRTVAPVYAHLTRMQTVAPVSAHPTRMQTLTLSCG